MNVVTLRESNYRQVVPTLRAIADEIERGEHGEVSCAALVVFGDELKVFGAGPDSEAPTVALLLHAGFNSFSRAIEQHGLV